MAAKLDKNAPVEGTVFVYILLGCIRPAQELV